MPCTTQASPAEPTRGKVNRLIARTHAGAKSWEQPARETGRQVWRSHGFDRRHQCTSHGFDRRHVMHQKTIKSNRPHTCCRPSHASNHHPLSPPSSRPASPTLLSIYTPTHAIAPCYTPHTRTHSTLAVWMYTVASPLMNAPALLWHKFTVQVSSVWFFWLGGAVNSWVQFRLCSGYAFWDTSMRLGSIFSYS